MRILVHEWITGGGLSGRPLPQDLAREGRAMRRAVVDDFLAVGGIEVVETLDPRFADEAGRAEAAVVLGARKETTLPRLAAACDFTLAIAPETAGALAGLAGVIEESGGRPLGSTSSAIRLTA